MPVAIGSGLEGVIAAESRLCFIDGEAGILSYQGYDIRTLGEKATFEEVIFLLWNGRLPKKAELGQLKAGLVAHREIPAPVESFVKNAPKGAVPMAVLRTAVQGNGGNVGVYASGLRGGRVRRGDGAGLT